MTSKIVEDILSQPNEIGWRFLNSMFKTIRKQNISEEARATLRSHFDGFRLDSVLRCSNDPFLYFLLSFFLSFFF